MARSLDVRSGADALLGVRADVCVVGSGPVGLAVAAGLVRNGLRCLVLEAGPQHSAPVAQLAEPLAGIATLSDTHAPLHLALSPSLGGASWLWGGRCLPLDPIDYVERPEIGRDGWPLDNSDISAWLEPAGAFLGCGPAIFQHTQEAPAQIRTNTLERWCNDPNVIHSLKRNGSLDGVVFVAEATVTGLLLDPTADRVSGLKVTVRGQTVDFTAAKAFVLACGGLQTTRLLLNVQAGHPRLFGGPSGDLGRFYMGHISGQAAAVRFRRPNDAERFRFTTGTTAARRRITLPEQTLREEKLPNMCFYPSTPAIGDPRHCSGILSAIYLLMNAPVLSKYFVSESIRLMQLTAEPDYGNHLKNVLMSMPSTALSLSDLAVQKLIRRRRRPFFFPVNSSGLYPLHYHAEHLPHRDSAIRLGNQMHSDGIRSVDVELKFKESDFLGVFRAHRSLRDLSSKEGLLAVEFDEQGLLENIRAQARDGYHQIGGVRMGRGSGDGVVDRNGRLFDFSNCFVAGSAIFRSSGQANPTFTAVALALRLADHLHNVFGGAHVGHAGR